GIESGGAVCWLFSLLCLQAGDGIRDRNVTGVQTCALPILNVRRITMQKEVANKKIDELLHELPYYMNDFVIVKTADEYSPNTILEYLKNFHQFLIWLIENHYVN